MERATPLSGVAAASTGVLSVFQPLPVLRWTLTAVPSCAGVTRPEKRTRWPRRGVLSLTFRPTRTRTPTVTSALVAGGEDFASTR